MSITKTISLSITLPDEATCNGLAAALRIVASQLEVQVITPPAAPAAQPAAEAPPAYDKCRALWEAAQKVAPAGSLFSIHDYVGRGLQQGVPHIHEGRMPQETQDRLEAAIMALGRSDWGQEWLSHDENAAQIDRAYCFEFVGYWVTRAHPTNPEMGYVRHTGRPL